jgi:O-methyltransferase domain
MLEQIGGAPRTQLLAVVARYGIADLLGEQPATAADLAGRLKLNSESLGRTLRALVAGGLFDLDRATGRYSNNRLSNALRTEAFGSMRAFAEYFAAPYNLEAWARLDSVLRTGKNAFESIHGMTPWEYFAAHPADEAIFAQAMTSLTEIDAPAIARGYPFRKLASVCDVGGGRGTLLAELLRVHATLRGGILDAPGVAPLARQFLEARGVLERAQIHAGNLFEQVPEGYAAYLLKDVLHDWDAPRCEAILRTVRRAAAPGARLLICEVLVEPLEASFPGAMIDLQMMVALSEGRQRSRAELRDLFGATGFRFERVWPTAFPISVIEGVAI